jgi:hypothetical protein
MSTQKTAEARETPELAAFHLSIARLPITLRPSLNQQLAEWEMLFPFEQKHITRFLDAIDSFNPTALNELTAKLRTLEIGMGVDRWNFSETGDTMENAGQLARSEHFLEWRREVQEVFEAIDAKGRASEKREPECSRLILVFLPEYLPVAPNTAWKQWAPEGREIKIAGDSRKLRELVVRGHSDQPSICDLLKQEENHDSADLWFIDTNSTLANPLTPFSAYSASCLDYALLKRFSDRFRAELNRIPKDMTAADQTALILRQTDWTRWWPSDLSGQERLRSFMVNLFLSGNGALIFPNSFVEWAASEALRRARPRVMVACFGMRSKPKPFTGIAIFENQESISAVPDVDDPENSAVDAVILARYIWLAAHRYLEYDRALYLCISEHLNTAYIVGPPEIDSRASDEPVAPQEIYHWIASWLAS